MFSQEEAKNMPPHHEFDHKIHLENDQTPPCSPLCLLLVTLHLSSPQESDPSHMTYCPAGCLVML